jgi:hypothetical protein
MERQGHRRIFWTVIVVGLLGVLGLAAWVTSQNRYEIDAWWCCNQLAKARTEEDADRWRRRLWTEPGRRAKLEATLRRFRCGEQWLDYWLLYPRRPQDVIDETGYWEERARATLAEAKRRPQIVPAWLHMNWWVASALAAHNADPVGYLNGMDSVVSRLQSRHDSEGPGSWRMALEVQILCWATDTAYLSDDLSDANWREVYARWKGWADENARFLEFNPETERCEVNVEAKASGEALPADGRPRTLIAAPLPGWEGDVPKPR